MIVYVIQYIYFTMFFHSTCSSVCPSWISCGERERSTLGNGWLGYSPRSRKEWHHHILYCPAARHTWCCCPEWDSCSAGPNLWLTSVTCSQLHQFEAIHQIRVESCSHNHCWSWAIFSKFSFPYTGVEWVLGIVRYKVLLLFFCNCSCSHSYVYYYCISPSTVVQCCQSFTKRHVSMYSYLPNSPRASIWTEVWGNHRHFSEHHLGITKATQWCHCSISSGT